MLPSRRRLFQQDNVKPHTAAITTARHCSRRVRVLNCPAYSPDISPIENIWCIIKKKICQRRLQTHQASMGPNSNTKTPETHNLNAQTSSNCFEKKRRCYTTVNMPPSQLFWDLWQASNLKWANFVQKISTFISSNTFVMLCMFYCVCSKIFRIRVVWYSVNYNTCHDSNLDNTLNGTESTELFLVYFLLFAVERWIFILSNYKLNTNSK